MSVTSLVVAVVLGVVQGVLEWLPVSSEGNVSLLLAALGSSPAAAVQYALFLHLGTAIAATTYYRGTIFELVRELPKWRTSPDRRDLTFLVVATLVSGVVGVGSYVLLVDLVSALAGGTFIALIGALLVLTGVVERVGVGVDSDANEDPDLLDALLVGVGQGLAVLPGISRSGTTVSVLLLRGQDAEAAFRLSFLLSIPAAVGASVLVVAESGVGFPAAAVVALSVSAVVGYFTLEVLMRVARRVAFWAVCVGLGSLAVVGGLLVQFT